MTKQIPHHVINQKLLETQVLADGHNGAVPIRFAVARVCAWCKAPMGFASFSSEKPGEITHGVCPVCAKEFIRDAVECVPATLRAQSSHAPEPAGNHGVNGEVMASYPSPARSFLVRCWNGSFNQRGPRLARLLSLSHKEWGLTW